MSGFQKRALLAEKFENSLFARLAEMGFVIAANGTEHTHPGFVARLKNSGDQTSLAIRFQPDAVAAIGKIPRSFYVEAKAAKTIEKQAWEQYEKLIGNGNILAIVFEGFSWAWNFWQHIRLMPAEETIGRYPVHQRFPVIDGWVTPRGSQQWKKIRTATPYASGTAFREVDRKSLLPFASFKEIVIAKLAGTEK